MLRELDIPEHKELALLGFKLASLVFKLIINFGAAHDKEKIQQYLTASNKRIN